MKQLRRRAPAALFVLACASPAAAVQPPLTGTPVIIEPDLLNWPDDFPEETPNLSEPTSNRLADFHGEIRDCDIVLSTAGNYHMALKELWQSYLYTYVDDLDIRNWYYTTSPPVSKQQIPNGVVQFGNLMARCRPQVAVGPVGYINELKAMGVTEGNPVPIIKNYGNVILVKKGNPKNIQSIWDLGKRTVSLATPNPSEGGSYNNFISTVYGVAANDPNPPDGQTAEDLFNTIFNSAVVTDTDANDDGCAHHHSAHKPKWVAGKRIMHREIPWLIYSGHADAGVIFYHLALLAVRTFPDQFEIVPLGGTVDNPQPVLGNNLGTMSAIRVAPEVGVPFTAKQLEARERLMTALQSAEFTTILGQHGLRRP